MSGWRRQQALLRRLPEFWKRLKGIERRLGIRDAGDEREE
jgi:hypothetical protein